MFKSFLDNNKGKNLYVIYMSFEETELFKGIDLTNAKDNEEYIGDFDTVRENFNMLFDVLPEYDETHQRLALDYYNNFRVEISYPNKFTIEGKFIIENGELDGYIFHDPDGGRFNIPDFVENNEQIEASYVVSMISRKTCKLVYWFDDFFQNGDTLESGKILTNAKYWRIPPNRGQSCREFMEQPHKKPDYKMEMALVAVGGKRKKKRIIRTQRTKRKRKRNKRTRRTKRR